MRISISVKTGLAESMSFLNDSQVGYLFSYLILYFKMEACENPRLALISWVQVFILHLPHEGAAPAQSQSLPCVPFLPSTFQGPKSFHVEP